MSSYLIIIPCYNETNNIPSLLVELEKNGLLGLTIFVDDFSSDDSVNILRRAGARVLNNQYGKGQGGALQTAYDYVLRIGGIERLVVIDCDGQHPVASIPDNLRVFGSSGMDIMFASRVKGTDNSGSIIRAFGTKIFSYIVSKVWGLKITDCSTGYKIFKTEILREFRLVESQYQALDFLSECVVNDLKIAEFSVDYQRRRFGKSKKGGTLLYSVAFAATLMRMSLKIFRYKLARYKTLI
jgi:glycosyltransferase involved in cell wall biosynthesis